MKPSQQTAPDNLAANVAYKPTPLPASVRGHIQGTLMTTEKARVIPPGPLIHWTN